MHPLRILKVLCKDTKTLAYFGDRESKNNLDYLLGRKWVALYDRHNNGKVWVHITESGRKIMSDR